MAHKRKSERKSLMCGIVPYIQYRIVHIVHYTRYSVFTLNYNRLLHTIAIYHYISLYIYTLCAMINFAAKQVPSGRTKGELHARSRSTCAQWPCSEQIGYSDAIIRASKPISYKPIIHIPYHHIPPKKQWVSCVEQLLWITQKSHLWCASMMILESSYGWHIHHIRS